MHPLVPIVPLYKPMKLTLVHSVYDATNTGSFSFPSVNFGTAQSDRLLIGLISYRRNTALGISGVTIGGVSATVHAGVATSIDDTFIFSAPVPTGTSGTVAMTMNSAGASLVMYSLTGHNSNTPVFSDYQTAGSPLSSTLTIGARTAVLASACVGTGASGYGGTAGVVQDYLLDPATSVGDMQHRVASLLTTASLGSKTITHAASGGSKMAVVTWQ